MSWIATTDINQSPFLAVGGPLHPTSPLQHWSLVASSDDGSKLVAAVWQGYIYTSQDSGSTWTESTSSTRQAWSAVDTSGDGNKLVALSGDMGYAEGLIHTSHNSGLTWTLSTYSTNTSLHGRFSWLAVASSSDGNKLAAVGELHILDAIIGKKSLLSYIYTSKDS